MDNEEKKIAENNEEAIKKTANSSKIKTPGVITAVEAAFNKVGVWKLDDQVQSEADPSYIENWPAD